MNFVNNIVLDLKDLYNAHNKHFGTGTNYEKGLYFFTVKHEINEKQPIVQKQIIKKKSKKPIKENKEQLNHKLILELKEKLKKLQEKKNKLNI